jgi:hypothetical protein
MEMEIIADRGHRDPCIVCESLWTLPERIGRGTVGQG